MVSSQTRLMYCQRETARSRASSFGLAYQGEGAITICSGLYPSQPAHQLKLLLAMMWCLHALINARSCSGLSAFPVTKTADGSSESSARAHSGASENTMKWHSGQRFLMRLIARR